jgi:hypothetical protein
MVDKHPCRHDPSHIVTHRIQGGIVEFADCLLKASSPKKNRKWSSFLQLLNMVVIDLRQRGSKYYLLLCIYVVFSSSLACFCSKILVIEMDMFCAPSWLVPT